MSASMTLRVRLGPLVFFEVEGDSCLEIAKALDGYEQLNKTVDEMFSDLAERVYPEGVDMEPPYETAASVDIPRPKPHGAPAKKAAAKKPQKAKAKKAGRRKPA